MRWMRDFVNILYGQNHLYGFFILSSCVYWDILDRHSFICCNAWRANISFNVRPYVLIFVTRPHSLHDVCKVTDFPFNKYTNNDSKDLVQKIHQFFWNHLSTCQGFVMSSRMFSRISCQEIWIFVQSPD
uniref:Uncharacterized protein n=1 Tax=Cacopsylla melanoneura TaxID=428564 RepID=A0A8D8L7U0_9HEMI